MIFYNVYLFHKPATRLRLHGDDSAVHLIIILDTTLGPGGATSKNTKSCDCLVVMADNSARTTEQKSWFLSIWLPLELLCSFEEGV